MSGYILWDNIRDSRHGSGELKTWHDAARACAPFNDDAYRVGQGGRYDVRHADGTRVTMAELDVIFGITD